MATAKPELLIYQKYLSLVQYAHDIVRKYPKSEKFALAVETRRTTIEGIRYIVYAEKLISKKDKMKYLHELDACLKVQKVHMRLAYNFRYISQQNYESWSKLITDVGNLLGAWINSCTR